MAIKTTVITGATSGIGKATATALAQKGHAIYMLVRDVNKGERLRQEIIQLSRNKEVHVLHCDLADLESVKVAADALSAKLFNINVLINNAGGAFDKRELSVDGYELTFAANHLGHFLLTLSLMPLLKRGQARIINLSSEAHKMGRPDFDDAPRREGDYSAMRVYGSAKLYNIYFTKSLAERCKADGITAFAVHPGVVNTAFGAGLSGLGKWLLAVARPFMIDAEKGAETSIYLATAQRLDEKTGLYFKKCKPASTAKAANEEAARNQLWQLSQKLVAAYL